MKRTVEAVASVVCVLAPLARAGPVTWQVTGVVTEIRDPYGELGGLVQLGDDFAASYTFLASTPDSVLHDPHSGRYVDAVDSITGAVGTIPFSSHDPFGQISIGNFKGSKDHYTVGLSGLSTPLDEPGDCPTEFWLVLADPSGAVFTSDALPLAPPPLDAFDARSLYLQIGSDRIEIFGEVTALVPEPSSLVILAISAAALLRRRRTRWRGRTVIFAVLIVFAPQLLIAQQWPSTSGPVLIGGDDADDHFQATLTYPTGKTYIRHGFNFLGVHVQNGKTKAICIGCNPGEARESFESAFDASAISVNQGGAWSRADPLTSTAEIEGFFSNSNLPPAPNIQDTGIIYLPSDVGNIAGGIAAAQLNKVNENVGILTPFVQSGGGLFTHTLAGLNTGLTSPKYTWAGGPSLQRWGSRI